MNKRERERFAQRITSEESRVNRLIAQLFTVENETARLHARLVDANTTIDVCRRSSEENLDAARAARAELAKVSRFSEGIIAGMSDAHADILDELEGWMPDFGRTSQRVKGLRLALTERQSDVDRLTNDKTYLQAELRRAYASLDRSRARVKRAPPK